MKLTLNCFIDIEVITLSSIEAPNFSSWIFFCFILKLIEVKNIFLEMKNKNNKSSSILI